MNTGNNSKWFPHDADALEDPKIMILITQLGWEGFGLFWMLIQRLSKQPGYILPLNLLDSISRVSQISKEKLEAIVTKFGLFEVEDDFFYSPSLIRRMEPFEKRMQINKANAVKGWETRKQKQPENNAIALPLHSDGNEYNITQHNITQHNITQHNKTKYNIKKEKKKEEDKTESEDSDPSSLLIDNSFHSEENINIVQDPGEAEKLFNQVIENFPEDVRPKNLKQKAEWIDTLDKLMRIDKFTPEQIMEVIKFAREDPFWRTNFLSILKLRKNNKEGIKNFNVFRHAMNGARRAGSGSGSRSIKRINSQWENVAAPTIKEIKKEDPFARFDKNILKLFDYLKFGKLPNTKDPVFPDEAIPDSEEKVIIWLRYIENLMLAGYSILAIQNVIIYARESLFWQKHFLDISLLLEKGKYSKSYFDIISDEIYNKKHGVIISQAEYDSLGSELEKRFDNQ